MSIYQQTKRFYVENGRDLTFEKDGVVYSRRGSSSRCAFWDGYFYPADRSPAMGAPQSRNRAAFQAGKECRRADDRAGRFPCVVDLRAVTAGGVRRFKQTPRAESAAAETGSEGATETRKRQ